MEEIRIDTKEKLMAWIGKPLRMIWTRLTPPVGRAKDAIAQDEAWYVEYCYPTRFCIRTMSMIYPFTDEPYSVFTDSYYFVPYESVGVRTSNKDRKTCYKCGCVTELRRNFSDMSIHNMCPRCKI